MTLFKIDELIIKAIEFGYDPETGEILDESALNELQMEKRDKIENLCLYEKDLRAEAAAIGEEQIALGKRKFAKLKKADSIKQYIQKSLDGEKFETARCGVKYRMSEAVNVTDASLIPDKYLRTKTTSEPNKDAIKKALKSGDTVPGATLEKHNNMTIV